jgi:hypothetical protein
MSLGASWIWSVPPLTVARRRRAAGSRGRWLRSRRRCGGLDGGGERRRDAVSLSDHGEAAGDEQPPSQLAELRVVVDDQH